MLQAKLTNLVSMITNSLIYLTNLKNILLICFRINARKPRNFP